MSLLNKFSHVEIKADARISEADRAVCLREQEAFDKSGPALEQLADLYDTLNEEQHSILSEDSKEFYNPYMHAGNFRFASDDACHAMEARNESFIERVVSYFVHTYSVKLNAYEIKKHLIPEKPSDDFVDVRRYREWNSLTEEEQAEFNKKCAEHKRLMDKHMVAVIFQEKPDGVPEAERMDDLWNIMRREVECSDRYTDHFLALTVTADHIREWKKLSKDWKAGKANKTGAVPVKLTAQNNDGGVVEGYYDPRYLVDAVEAIGPSAMIYIGRYGRQSCFCSLLVYPKNWTEDTNHATGYVLPLRIS